METCYLKGEGVMVMKLYEKLNILNLQPSPTAISLYIKCVSKSENDIEKFYGKEYLNSFFPAKKKKKIFPKSAETGEEVFEEEKKVNGSQQYEEQIPQFEKRVFIHPITEEILDYPEICIVLECKCSRCGNDFDENYLVNVFSIFSKF